jgi:hypothetical protein
MTRESRQAPHLEPVDDATIEQLVRDVAAGWTMPPVRLDAPSWRDRVRSRRSRGLDSARGWLGRVGQAATAAVALTVTGALLAVLITRQPTTPGKSAEPTAGPHTPLPTGAAVTPLPKLLVDGTVPNPSTVLVALQEGDFALVDLATGERGPSITSAAFGSLLRWRSDGTLMCLCVKEASNVNTQPTEAAITLDRFDAGGELLSTVAVLDLFGDADPRDGPLPERPPHLTFDLRFSEGGRFGVIGWSVRKHPAWENGITVIDLEDGHVVSRLELPDDTTGEGSTRRVVTAPRLLSTRDGGVTIAREWYSWSPPESQGESYRQGTDVFRATLRGGVLSDAGPVAATTGCGERVLRAGAASDGRSWMVCTDAATNTIVLRRLAADGTRLGDTPASGAVGVDGDSVAVSPDGRAVFAWNPATATLTRIDVTTGEKAEGQAQVASLEPGPLAGVAHWLAPTAAAKTFLYGGILVSPDGTRVYAAGIDEGTTEHDMSGSSGIFVFDAATLTNLGHWEPAADYISLGISSDGRYVYASGLPRVDANGQPRPGQEASISVHAAADGEVQVIAGQLGEQFLLFPEPVQD